MSAYSEPALPIDVCGSILDIIAIESLVQLKNCALVSRVFASLAQRHLFDRLCLISFSKRNSKRLKQLLSILKESPHIASYVRSLTIDLRGYTGCRLSHKSLVSAQGSLSSFVNLQVLCVSHFESGMDRRHLDTVSAGNAVISLIRHLVNTYVSQQGLHGLTVEDIPDISVTEVFSCKFTQYLSLTRVLDMSVQRSYPTSRITSLSIHDTASFDLSILFSLPELTELMLSNLAPTFDNRIDQGMPSFGIEQLSLIFREPGQAAFVVEWYKKLGTKAGVPALAKLYKLKFGFVCTRDTLAFNTILEDRPPLQCLTLLADGYDSDGVFPLNTIGLAEYFQARPQPTAHFGVRIRMMSTFDPFLSELVIFLTSIANLNSLKEMKYVLTAEFVNIELPLSDMWYSISSLLSSGDNFPKLDTASFILPLLTDHTSVQSEAWTMLVGNGIQSEILNALSALRARFGESKGLEVRAYTQSLY